jgi:hypothetical protein
MLAPSNLATSSAEVNMSFMNAVFRKTLKGAPVSFNFLTISTFWSSSRTTPVAAIRKLALTLD